MSQNGTLDLLLLADTKKANAAISLKTVKCTMYTLLDNNQVLTQATVLKREFRNTSVQLQQF